MATKKKYENWGEYLYWVYANMNMSFNPRSLIFIENMMKTAFDKREEEQEE